MTFVLVGAGPTGVELAASMAHMVAHTLRGNFRRIDPAQSTIILVEAGNRILPTFTESLSKRAARRLQKLGVNVETGVKVDRVDAQGVIAGGKKIPSATVLWTAGVAASPIVKMLGAKTDRAGRVSVGPFMNVPDLPSVFVIGDAASVTQGGRPVPGVAQAAIQQGRYVGQLISAQVRGQKPKASVSIFQQGNDRSCWQELCRVGSRLASHERIYRLACVGVCSPDDVAAAAKSAASPTSVALVVFHRTTQCAPDFRGLRTNKFG